MIDPRPGCSLRPARPAPAAVRACPRRCWRAAALAALGWLGLAAASAAQAQAAPAAVSAATADAAGSAGTDGAERVLRAGDSRLRVIVEGVHDPAVIVRWQRWLAECAQAARGADGRFPLRTAQVRILPARGRRRGDGDSPVPWGQTVREGGSVSVLLYVREDASLDALRADWTAVHELAHLFHPYLGPDGRWLAEGLASYYQNVLRARVGLLGAEEAWRRLDAGFRRGRAVGGGARMDAVGWNRAQTMRIYWAGAAFWLQADLALRRERSLGLDELLARYARCCLDGNAEIAPQAFVAALDRVGGGGVLARLYAQHAALTRFPSLERDYAALGIDTEGGALRFSPAPAAARLRAAIMQPPASARSPAP